MLKEETKKETTIGKVLKLLSVWVLATQFDLGSYRPYGSQLLSPILECILLSYNHDIFIEGMFSESYLWRFVDEFIKYLSIIVIQFLDHTI